jgi:eukaryotic-like serine/threonine-protein kinase
MAILDADRWRVVSPYLDEVLGLPATEREASISRLAERDPGLAADVALLMARHQALIDEEFLERPPLSPLHGGPGAGFVVGPYTLVAPLGEGGMGSVWLARRSDGRYDGQVAIKFLASALSRRAEQRFRREGNVLARLTHPHIAHLIDAGIAPAGQPYLVLEYVDGQDIASYCARHQLDTGGIVRLFLDVLDAVAHAHANLVVHRDIKPSNVFVTSNGQVKLLDFGIAKLLEDETADGNATMVTRDGGVMTLAYAAPEQVSGQPVSTATDVYTLGVLLYCLLTGHHPSAPEASSTADLVKAIVEGEPAAMSGARPGVSNDLDTIVAKALKKNPRERYQSVTAFAEDLRRTLAHQPISARPDSVVYRTAKFVRRNRLAVALAAAALVAAAGGVAGSLIQGRRAAEQRDFALRQLSRAEAINDLNNFLLVDAAPGGKPFTVNDLLARAEHIVDRQSGDVASRAELLVAIGRQYATQDEDGKAAAVLTRAYALSRQLQDPSIRAKASCALAPIFAKQGDLARGQSAFDEGLGELPSAPQFIADRSFCLLRGAELARANGDAPTSVTRATAALTLLESLPLRSQMLELRAVMDIAESYRVAGRFLEATRAFEKAAAQLATLGRDDTQTAGTLYNNWALALNQLGRPVDAEPIFRRGIEISRADGADAAVSPMLLNNYARVLRDLNRLGEAAGYAERAYARGTLAGDEVVINQALIVRATIYREQGDTARAAAMIDEVEPKWLRSFPPGHVTVASVATQRALIAQARGDLDEAARQVGKALAVAEELARTGREGNNYLPLVLLRRAELLIQRGQPEPAVADAARAVDLLRKVAAEGLLTADLGRAFRVLAAAQRAAGHHDESASSLELASRHLDSSLGSNHPEAVAVRALRARAAQ